MQEPHTEEAVNHTDGEQNTGNHAAPQTPPHTPGGTRSGAENVEPNGGNPSKAAENLDELLSVNGPSEIDPQI